jgi:2-keto-4-pentenoate hydratase
MNLDLDKAATALVRDHAEQRNIVPFARAWGAVDLAGAYAIQSAFVERMRATQGPRVGYKIGLTSERMQKMCSVDHPVVGVVLKKRLYPTGARLQLGSLVRLGIEFEICVRLGRSLSPRETAYEMEEVAKAVDAVAPAFEVIDDRNSAYPLDLLSLVADNAWNEGVVLGEWRTSWPDLAAARGVVECNGAVIDQGHGRDVLGHPFEPLRWLANHLRTQGESLHAGEIVSTGSLVTTRFPAAGERYRFTVEGVGAVDITLDA